MATMVLAMTTSALSPVWWKEFAREWNCSPFKDSLRNFGSVCFRVVGEPECDVVVNFNDNGFASLMSDSPDGDALIGTRGIWEAFLNYETDSAAAIFRGDLRFTGQPSRIVAYFDAFNQARSVASKVSL